MDALALTLLEKETGLLTLWPRMARVSPCSLPSGGLPLQLLSLLFFLGIV